MVIGVDPDKERIQLAKESHSQIENLSFVEGSAINSFDSLKVGGKVAVQYMSYLPLFDYNTYVLLNPENAERIFCLFHLE
ncbi:unnamed protein product [Porites lobata]|uniref:Uncharacterized protein n=1 Tax=Porites lobata TaxID=104759 RepID=A0ABN8NJ29_9CNID|nr:unnamed protein product [Porites lobata]